MSDLSRGRFKVQIGNFEIGGTSESPIAECYETANRFYKPELLDEMKLWVHIDRWSALQVEGKDDYCQLPYAGPTEGEQNV